MAAVNIGFVGLGNMCGAILGGYSSRGIKDGNSLFGYTPNQQKLMTMAEEIGFTPCQSIEDLVEASEVVFLGVKPNVISQVLAEVKKAYDPSKVVVSMAAGITIERIESVLGAEASVVRIMPNTPALVGEGMTSISPNDRVEPAMLNHVLRVMEAVGDTAIVDESRIHGVIGISGSSPAYTYMYIEALQKAAMEEGFGEDEAKTFAAQAVLGAAKMVLEREESLEQLKNNVCSPGGTTIEAVQKLDADGFQDIVAEGFRAAVKKSKEMAE